MEQLIGFPSGPIRAESSGMSDPARKITLAEMRASGVRRLLVGGTGPIRAAGRSIG